MSSFNVASGKKTISCSDTFLFRSEEFCKPHNTWWGNDLWRTPSYALLSEKALNTSILVLLNLPQTAEYEEVKNNSNVDLDVSRWHRLHEAVGNIKEQWCPSCEDSRALIPTIYMVTFKGPMLAKFTFPMFCDSNKLYISSLSVNSKVHTETTLLLFACVTHSSRSPFWCHIWYWCLTDTSPRIVMTPPTRCSTYFPFQTWGVYNKPSLLAGSWTEWLSCKQRAKYAPFWR